MDKKITIQLELTFNNAMLLYCLVNASDTRQRILLGSVRGITKEDIESYIKESKALYDTVIEAKSMKALLKLHNLINKNNEE